ncbi:MAG: DNA alkylation repair protein [Bacteroidota bacterium]
MDIEAYSKKVITHFKGNANKEISEKQEKYMRNQFQFFGIKSKEASIITKEIFNLYKYPSSANEVNALSLRLFKEPQRELHYFVLDVIQKSIKKQEKNYIEFLEKVITTKSWWDTVDWINNFVGIHFKRYPELQYKKCYEWMDGENIWLKRVAIIHQLKYKNDVDEVLLYDLITKEKFSKEFFIQKAAGWALRQYSKFNPKSVEQFLSQNPNLPKLTIREGSKYI